MHKDATEYWSDKIASFIAVGCMCFVVSRFNAGVLYAKSAVLLGWQARICIILVIVFFTAIDPTPLKRPFQKRLLGLLITLLMYVGSSLFDWWNDYMVFVMMAMWLAADYFLSEHLEKKWLARKEQIGGDKLDGKK